MAKVIDHKKAEKAEARKVKDTAFMGKKTYRMTEPHYRKGKYYPAGSIITVVDEKPSATWELVEDDASKGAPAAEHHGKDKKHHHRAVDRDI